MEAGTLRRFLADLYDAHGPQHWWPHQGHPFEIMVGAVLTQNTAWSNVEKAIARLQAAEALDPRRMLSMEHEALAELIRPSGYFNIKATRLRNLCHWYREAGGFDALARQTTETLRRELLAVKGVGPETCDDILLYAFRRPVFVVDAYTFRIFERTGLIRPGHSYESLRAMVETALGKDEAAFNELHALIVRHGSQVCRPRPHCEHCVLREGCAFNIEQVTSRS